MMLKPVTTGWLVIETGFRKPDAPDEWIIEDDGIDPALIHQLTDFTTGKLQ